MILGTISLICSLFDRDGRIQHNLARFWSWLIMKTILSPVKVTGMDMDPRIDDTSKPRVYAVTHASALDIPILYVHLPFQFRIIFKSELLAYPFIGWHLKRSGQVCINQQNPAASIGAIKSALRSLRSGMPLVIFPEGGRTRDGKIQPFLPGAFFLAIKAQADYRAHRARRHLRSAADEHLPHQVPAAGDAGWRDNSHRRVDRARYGRGVGQSEVRNRSSAFRAQNHVGIPKTLASFARRDRRGPLTSCGASPRWAGEGTCPNASK